MKFPATAILVIFLVSGCTWVKPTPGGERIRVVSSAAEISACKKIGETNVSLLSKVGFFKRSPDKVEEELTILGRNSAADMGGDTILPVSAVDQGQRSFSVYRCGSR